MHLINAAKQFNENLRLFGNPETEPEKYNLYAGLQNLAIGLSSLENKVEALKNQLAIKVLR